MFSSALVAKVLVLAGVFFLLFLVFAAFSVTVSKNVAQMAFEVGFSLLSSDVVSKSRLSSVLTGVRSLILVLRSSVVLAEVSVSGGSSVFLTVVVVFLLSVESRCGCAIEVSLGRVLLFLIFFVLQVG